MSKETYPTKDSDVIDVESTEIPGSAPSSHQRATYSLFWMFGVFLVSGLLGIGSGYFIADFSSSHQPIAPQTSENSSRLFAQMNTLSQETTQNNQIIEGALQNLEKQVSSLREETSQGHQNTLQALQKATDYLARNNQEILKNLKLSREELMRFSVKVAENPHPSQLLPQGVPTPSTEIFLNFKVFIQKLRDGLPFERELFPLRAFARGETIILLDNYAQKGALTTETLLKELVALEHIWSLKSETAQKNNKSEVKSPFLSWFLSSFQHLIKLQSPGEEKASLWLEKLRKAHSLLSDNREQEAILLLEKSPPPPEIQTWLTHLKEHRALKEAVQGLAFDLLTHF